MKRSRYIAQLKDKAEERKKEESIIFDRRQVTLSHHSSGVCNIVQWRLSPIARTLE